MMGNTRIRPGPFTPVKRPRVNMTPRSYSFSTLTALKIRKAIRTTTTILKVIKLSPESNGLDPKPQPAHFDDTHGLAGTYGGVALRVPKLSAIEHATATLGEILHRIDGGPDHPLLARNHRTAH